MTKLAYRNRPGVAMAPTKETTDKKIPLDFVGVGSTVGYQSFFLQYTDLGGPGNLDPGFPTAETTAVNWPPNASQAIVFLRGFSGAFVESDNANQINDHDFGAMAVNCFFQDSNTIAVEFQLTDQSVSEPVTMWANGMILFFG